MTTPPDSRLPTQLRVVGATDLERRLLDAGSRELPSVELTRKMQQALGISIAAGALTAAAVKSSATPAATAATGAPAFAWPVISVGVLALAVTGAVVGLRSTTSHHATSRPAVTAPAVVLGPAPVAPEPIAAPAPAPTARAVEHPASISARAHRRAGVTATPSDLRAEIALVDAARSAVTTGADDRALALLHRYESSYRAGTFRPEVTALRIEALDHLGRTAQARTLAQRFIAAHPDSPLADRVARVTGTTTR
ncbi:MAG TPA: hypothetical protein VLC06_03165 [Polyangia bacterium]|nr:hypothetical protein [Polyangia bacterium]